jgi:hypothetical protein
MRRLVTILAPLLFSTCLSPRHGTVLHRGLPFPPDRLRWHWLVVRLSRVVQPYDVADRRNRPESREKRRPEQPVAPSFSALELAAAAEVNRELARAHEELAEDAKQRLETRWAALEAAKALRARADSLHLEAIRASSDSASTPSIARPAAAYAGPERRTRTRRSGTCRRGGADPLAASGAGDRRTNPDRRQHDRRRNGSLLLR